MGLSSAVQWWDESQLHVLVLGSLFLQCYLAIFASARKSHIRPVFRFLIWLSYLGSDALAIYALATLFNRQKKVQYKSAQGSRDLELLWTPILLIHLGGQPTITAYNIEDNELWRRHLLTAVSQVTVALYVFCKSWSPSAERRLRSAAILLFIVGIMKCFERPFVFKKASFNNLVESFHPSQRRKGIFNELELEIYIQKASEYAREKRDATNNAEFEADSWSSGDDIEAQAMDFVEEMGQEFEGIERLTKSDALFLDFVCAYSVRLSMLKSFWSHDKLSSLHRALRKDLSYAFDLFYTKRNTLFSIGCLGDFSRLTLIVTRIFPMAALGLFHRSHKEAYTSTDVKLTYALLSFLLILDFYGFLAQYIFSTCTDTVAQHSLIGSFAYNKRHGFLRGVAGYLQCKGLLDQYWCMRPYKTSRGVTEAVRDHIERGWRNYISDAQSYMEFSDFRGQWTLDSMGCGQVLHQSLERPFDESVLIWHLATDFCICDMFAAEDSRASRCRVVSNYMVHLLFANPDMLMPGSRKNLFQDGYKQVEDILAGDYNSLDDVGRNLTKKIIRKVKSKGDGLLHDSWEVAQELLEIRDGKMWDVIHGVWIEMLCFSAVRCRGFLHAKSLGSGAECLSFIWLLMAHAGLETFPERQQRVHLRLQKEERVLAAMQSIQKEASEHSYPAPQGTVPYPAPLDSRVDEEPEEEENASTTSASRRDGTAPEFRGTD